MAEFNDEVLLKINYDTTDAQTALDELGKKTSDLGNKDIGGESLKSFKQQLKEAKDEALKLQLAGKMDTKEYQNAVRVIAQLRDEQDVLNRTTAAYDPGNKFQALAKVASLGANSIAGMTGAMTLFGVSTETANESIAKLQSIQAIIGLLDAWGDSVDFLKPFLQNLGLVKTATDAQTTATKAQAVATTGASKATNTLGTAFKALGIGLIISAVAYLVTNWDSLRGSIDKLFPSLGGIDNLFNKVKVTAFGVGNAILQYILTPIKALAKAVTGDFKGALEEVKNGFNVVKNYEAGANKERIAQADEKNKVLLKKEIENTEAKIAVQKAYGKDTFNLEKKVLQDKLKLYKKDSEEYKKALQDLQVLNASHYKKLQDDRKKDSDKVKAKVDADKAKIKTIEEEALKQLRVVNKLGRDAELEALKYDFNQKKELYKKYGADISNITTVFKAAEAAINKKYDDDINNYLKASTGANLSEFDKKKTALEAEITKLKENATPEQKAALDARLKSGIEGIDAEASATNNAANYDANLAATELSNEVTDSDTPDTAKAKIEAVRLAQIDAENAAFNLQKIQKAGQKAELEALEKDHQNKVTKINQSASKARTDIDKAEKEAKLNNLSTISGALNGFGALAKKGSIAGKALAIGSATIDTYVGANKALAQGGIMGTLAAAGIIAGGLANVAAIVKTDVTGGASSTPSAPTFAQPTINSTILQNANTVQDVNIVGTGSFIPDKITAVISDKDLEKQKQQAEYRNKLSSF